MKKNYVLRSSLALGLTVLTGHLFSQDLNKMDEDVKAVYMQPALAKIMPSPGEPKQQEKGPLPAPQACDTALTTFAAGNGQNGNMFDITATNAVAISAFDCHLDTASAGAAADSVKMYYIPSSYVGHNSTPSSWTYIGGAHVTSAGIGVATIVPINVNVTIPVGQTYGFYITRKSLTLKYTNGTAVGNVYRTKPDLSIKEGNGVAYPFGAIFPSSGTGSRIWNGIVHYCTTTTGIEGHISTTNAVIYPQPMVDQATIKITGLSPEEGVTLKIYDVTGKLVKASESKNAENISVSKDNLLAGMYFYHVYDSQNKIIAKGKLMVE